MGCQILYKIPLGHAKFSRKCDSGDAKFPGIPNSLGYTVRGCKMSRRDTKFPSEYGSGIPNSRGCQIPYDTGLTVMIVVKVYTVSDN